MFYGMTATAFDPAAAGIFSIRPGTSLELTDVAGALGVSLATAKRRLQRVTRRVFAMAAGDPVLSAYLARAGGEISK